MLLNKQKNNNNNIEKRINNPYFNRKCVSSSKINVNNVSKDKNILNLYNDNTNRDINIIKNENSQRNRIIDNSNNNISKTNMTYSKPRLLTEYSKRNSKINYSYKNNTSIKNRMKNEEIKNIKYLTLDEKINKNSKRNNKQKC